jgi:hypothetical protein
MALVGIVSLAERLLNQTFDSGQQVPPATQANKVSTTAEAGKAEDQFTPSSQASSATAQDAGLFTVSQFTLFSAAADFILAGTAGQPGQQNAAAGANTATGAATPVNANAPGSSNGSFALVVTEQTINATFEQFTGAAQQNPTAATNATTLANATTATNAANTQTAATQPNQGAAQNVTSAQNGALTQNAGGSNTNATTAGGNAGPTTAATTQPTVAQNAGATAVVAASGARGSNATVNVQQQLQSLNASLAALGLSHADISAIDRVASIINDFNPRAFTSLVQQLEAAAQTVSQQNAAATPATNAVTANSVNSGAAGPAGNAGANAGAATDAPAGNTTATNAVSNAGNANGAAGTSQVQELVIRFSGVQATSTTGAAGTVQASAFNLQIEEVNLTLTNGNGRALQVTAPASTTPVTEVTSATPLAKAAGAGV